MENIKSHQAGFYERVVKRIFDICLSLAALVIISPVALLCMIAIKLDDLSGSVFFKQPRNGKHGDVFEIVKFRTMKRERCGEKVLATPDTLTRPGRIIRLLSLDEIPQFVTILKGKMSFIGPRPLLLCYYEWYTETERRRFDVRPGLSGLSQVSGRANLNWDERFALDVEYADNISFLLDVKIFFKTFGVLLSHKDVLPSNAAVQEDFAEYRRKLQQPKKQVIHLSQPPKNSEYSKKTLRA